MLALLTTTLSNIGLTIPVLGTILLYGIGIAYTAGFYRSAGFPGYCGDFSLNEMLLLNWHSLLLLISLGTSVLGMISAAALWDALKKRRHGTPEVQTAAAQELAADEARQPALALQIVLFLLLLGGLVATSFAHGLGELLLAMLFGTLSAGGLLLAYRVQAYDLKWILAVISISAILCHASVYGAIDGAQRVATGRALTINLGSSSLTGRLVGQDSAYFYLVSGTERLQVLKSGVTSVHWQ